MLFSSTVALYLALGFLGASATPTPPAPPKNLQAIMDQYSLCDLSKAVMPTAPTPLPAPDGLKLGHIAVGQGTQNYTCKTPNSPEAPVQVGAVAELYNVTCASVNLSPDLFNRLPDLALNTGLPNPKATQAKALLSGHHYFTAAGVPFFDLAQGTHNFGSVGVKKLNQSSAPATAHKGPNGLGSVPWLLLGAVTGEYKAVYRLNTAGGVAPKTCEGMPAEFQVDYAALYWMWK